jgi:hypothetical protein
VECSSCSVKQAGTRSGQTGSRKAAVVSCRFPVLSLFLHSRYLLCVSRLAMRHLPFKALLFLLMAAVLAALLAPQALLTSANANDPPAGCHEHGPIVPAPAPSSHQCCQNGHDSAILLASSSSAPSFYVSAPVGLPQGKVALAVLSGLPSLAIVSGDPPLLSPLRV